MINSEKKATTMNENRGKYTKIDDKDAIQKSDHRIDSAMCLYVKVPIIQFGLFLRWKYFGVDTAFS